MSASMVHLHVHSEHSLLDGLSRLKDLLKKCQEYKMPAMALTDHGAMYGSHKFYNLFKDSGVKPIIGCEVYMAKRSRHDKENIDKEPRHLLLLAKNYQGYLNLMKIVSLANTEGFYYKARADEELLEKYHEGLICSSACLGSKVSKYILKNEIQKAKETADKYSKIFGERNYYLELQNHPAIPEQALANREIIKLSRELGLPLVATNDSHYTEADDAEAQELLLCVQTQKTILDKNRPLSMIGSPDFYFKSPEQMEKEFEETPEALKNTLKIAEMVDIQLPKTGFILPYYPIPEFKTADIVLKEMCDERIKKRMANDFKKPEVQTRLNYELDVIAKKGYSTYFLIVQDFVNWAKNQGIAVGPGRGSAAGSLVAYVLKITELNPLEFKLPFERFLNPSRPTPPDIDMDFADNRRDEVIQYVTQKYGKEKVAQIITFGTMEAKQAIRDTTRALGMPYSAGDRLSKMIPPPHQGHTFSIEKSMEISDDLKNAYQNEAETKKLLDLAKKLEGVTRHASTHAAGIIIADKELTEYTPLAREVKGERIVTQYDMYDLDKNAAEDAIGLLKMDFLGLRNLTILQEAIKYVKKYRKTDIDLTKIPLDNASVYEMISRGETTGVFQLESAGMRNLAKNLKPNKITDLSAMIALYRPGPMEWIPEFVASKEEPSKIKYLHPDLKSILEETYGIAVYQEQCMEIASKIAGYTLSEADSFRKAIGKKKSEIMKQEKKKFIEGCLSQKYQRDTSEQIFQLIEKFAGYGFNKAHSASYGLIAYQTAYMKNQFPIEYMTAILTAENRATSGPLKEEKMARLVTEVKRMGIPVLPPNINFSEIEFSIEKSQEKQTIRFGLSAIKNVGEAAIDSIILGRNEKLFSSFADFIARVDTQKVNKKTLESLIKAGALDQFGSRAALLFAMDIVRKNVDKEQKKKETGQNSLFEDHEEEQDKIDLTSLPDVEEFTKSELLAFEKQFLGFYLSEHPSMERLMKAGENLFKLSEVTVEDHLGKKMKLCGMIVAVKKIFTKKDGSEMAFVTIDDMSARLELVIFPKTYATHKEKLYDDNVIVFVGKIDSKEEKINILVEEIENG